MVQKIDPVKLKAAAVHFEWVCRQYPDVEVVQNLLGALAPLVEDAKAGRILAPRDWIPGGYFFGDGVYRAYEDPDVEDAYVDLKIELRGGLTEAEKRIDAYIESLRMARRAEVMS